MQIELSKDEMSILVERVTEKLRKEFTTQSITDVIYKDAEKLANRLVEIYRPEIETKCHSIDLLTPVVSKILKENDFLTNIVKDAIREHFSTDEFKKLSIQMLRNRISKLEDELSSQIEDGES
jgi:hypothetical protein